MATVKDMTDSLAPLRKSSQRRSALAAILAVGSLGLAACGSGADSGGGTSAEGEDRSLVGTIAAATLGGTNKVSPLGTGDIAHKSARPEAPGMLLVDSVRVASHEGFDRVVLDLVGEGRPGWFNIDGTTYPFELGREDPRIGTVEGAGNITQVKAVGTFEGRSQFIIGLKEKLPYSVEVLEDPHRVVIDIRRR